MFERDRVITWKNGSPRLKAQLVPTAKTEPKDFFTLGSSKDEVLAVQGSPDSFTETFFSYGSSSVIFERGKVVSWSDGFPKLKARLVSAANQ
jgi:hypothetical protein